MKRIVFNKRFVNEAGADLIEGKIHTIRQNYEWWKRFEGRDVALFTWEGKPYRSGQNVFCVKQIVSIQGFSFVNHLGSFYGFYGCGGFNRPVTKEDFAKNDGFGSFDEMLEWFHKYPSGEMAILHFTDFRY